MSGKVKSDGCTCRLVEQFAQHRGQVKGFQAEVDLSRIICPQGGASGKRRD